MLAYLDPAFTPVAAPAARVHLTTVHQRAPVLDALQAYRTAEGVSFSTPGHKQGPGLDRPMRRLLGRRFAQADVWLNTADHDRARRQAEELAAETWRADQSFFLVNGSSSGNQAFLLATLNPGDEVIVGRDLHQSLLTALILTGARPVYVAPRLHPELNVGLGVAQEDVAALLDAHPAAKLVIVTSPSYWGVASDLPAIVAAAAARGVPVYVDEAWGPHFGFHPELPVSAMQAGAMGAVTSPHKLLSGLSQAALLNVRRAGLDLARLSNAVRLTQTTSPLMPVLASLDACRRQMALRGGELMERALRLAAYGRQLLGALPGVRVLDAARLGLPAAQHDPTRLVIDVQGLGLTGYEAERMLREGHGVAPEMSDTAGLVCLVTLGDTRSSIRRLAQAVSALAGQARCAAGGARCPRVAGEAIAPGEQVLTPREAYFAPSRSVPLLAAAGAVAAEAVIPYPPGIPMLLPGEIISAVKLDCLRESLAAGMHVRGVADATLQTLRVVAG
ncbi:MAG: aminotransferase class I/II-fold pyridoxal phosphate-dependent enzyme [Thermomicrobiales bacterium]